jgi:GNAT superfamily N-acetyltransferase
LNHTYILFDGDDMIAGFEFDYTTPGLAQVRNVHVDPNYRKNGIGSFFYDYLISKNWMLYNDYSLTIESERIWKKLITKYPAKIFDKKTMAVYDFNQIGTKGLDGSIITLPEKDISHDKIQRWFYVVGKKLP